MAPQFFGYTIYQVIWPSPGTLVPDSWLFQGKVLDISNLRGFICLPTQEAEYSLSGFIPTNNQTNRTKPLHAGQSEERKKESEAELQ